MNKPDFEKLSEVLVSLTECDEGQKTIYQDGVIAGCEKIWNDYVVPSSGKSLEECRNEIARQFSYESFNIMVVMLGEHQIKHAKDSQLFVCMHSAAELYASSRTESLQKEIEELRKVLVKCDRTFGSLSNIVALLKESREQDLSELVHGIDIDFENIQAQIRDTISLPSSPTEIKN